MIAKTKIPQSLTTFFMAFWAPVLLLHLGGPDTITAYALADNDLWLRHFLGRIVQFGVSFYVFLRSWNGLPVNYLAIVMFAAGLIKYGERTVALWSASRDRFRNSMISRLDPGPNYANLMDEYQSKLAEGYIVSLGNSIDVSQVVDEPPEKARLSRIPQATDLHYGFHFFKTFKKLFADLILSFQDKMNSQNFFKETSWDRVFSLVEVELGLIYDLLYTKASLIHSKAGVFLRCFTLSSTVSVFIAFVITDKGIYSRIEVGITYTLLLGAIILEIYAVIVILSSDWAMIWLTDSSNMSHLKFRNTVSPVIYRTVSLLRLLHLVPAERRWSDKISQYNFCSVCTRDKPSKWTIILRFFGIYRFVREHKVPPGLKFLIFQELKSRTDKQQKSKRLDQEMLETEDCLGTTSNNEEINFDQSVLVWHIATDLCYYTDTENPVSVENPEAEMKSWVYRYSHISIAHGNSSSPENDLKFKREMSKWLSDYMFYLLIICPFMLPSGIGHIRFEDTRAEAIVFLKESTREGPAKIEVACQKLLQVNTKIRPSDVKGDSSKSVLFDSCRLANLLRKRAKSEGRNQWEIIFDVWVGILTYAAAECSWSDHAEQLRQGGELVTHVWLLMAHFGMTAQFQITKGYVRAKWQLG